MKSEEKWTYKTALLKLIEGLEDNRLIEMIYYFSSSLIYGGQKNE